MKKLLFVCILMSCSIALLPGCGDDDGGSGDTDTSLDVAGFLTTLGTGFVLVQEIGFFRCNFNTFT